MVYFIGGFIREDYTEEYEVDTYYAYDKEYGGKQIDELIDGYSEIGNFTFAFGLNIILIITKKEIIFYPIDIKETKKRYQVNIQEIREQSKLKWLLKKAIHFVKKRLINNKK